MHLDSIFFVHYDFLISCEVCLTNAPKGPLTVF